jgi:hypothetical protein
VKKNIYFLEPKELQACGTQRPRKIQNAYRWHANSIMIVALIQWEQCVCFLISMGLNIK